MTLKTFGLLFFLTSRRRSLSLLSARVTLTLSAPLKACTRNIITHTLLPALVQACNPIVLDGADDIKPAAVSREAAARAELVDLLTVIIRKVEPTCIQLLELASHPEIGGDFRKLWRAMLEGRDGFGGVDDIDACLDFDGEAILGRGHMEVGSDPIGSALAKAGTFDPFIFYEGWRFLESSTFHLQTSLSSFRDWVNKVVVPGEAGCLALRNARMIWFTSMHALLLDEQKGRFHRGVVMLLVGNGK